MNFHGQNVCRGLLKGFSKLVSNFVEASKNSDFDFFNNKASNNCKNHQRGYRKYLLNNKVLQTNTSSHDPIPLSQIPGLIPSSACLLVTHHYPINRVMQNPADRVLSTPFTGCFKNPCTWCSKISFSTLCSLMDEIQPLWMRTRRVVSAFDCQCQGRNSPGFDPSILRHSEIWGGRQMKQC